MDGKRRSTASRDAHKQTRHLLYVSRSCQWNHKLPCRAHSSRNWYSADEEGAKSVFGACPKRNQTSTRWLASTHLFFPSTQFSYLTGLSCNYTFFLKRQSKCGKCNRDRITSTRHTHTSLREENWPWQTCSFFLVNWSYEVKLYLS